MKAFRLTIRASVAFSIAFILSACQCRDPSVTTGGYARRAFQEQAAQKRQAFPKPRLDEVDREDLTVSVNLEQYEELDQQPYENTDQWLARLNEMLVLNQDALILSERGLEQMEILEKELISKIGELQNINHQIMELVESGEGHTEDTQQAIQGLMMRRSIPPFAIHMVEKGDTLFSIATKYYNDPQMVETIMLWNQGWMRNPDELVAGLGLVLFYDTKTENAQALVDGYLKQVDPRRR